MLKSTVLVLGIVLCAPTLASAAEDAAAFWKSKCANCHGPDGKGATKMGKRMKVQDLTNAEVQKTLDDAKMKKTIVEGIDTTVDGVKKKMDPNKDIKPEMLDALIQLIRSWAPKTPG